MNQTKSTTNSVSERAAATAQKTKAMKSKPARASMSSALSSSLDAETDAFQARLQRAERVLEGAPDESPSPPPRKTKSARRGRAAASPSNDETSTNEAPRVVRDAFTMPEDDYALIERMQQRCLKKAVRITKAEALRAGLHALSTMSDSDLLGVVESLEKVPLGRPKRGRRC